MFGIVAGSAGGAAAIAAMEFLSARAHFPLIFIPFATSIVLVMGMPDSQPAQPRALIGGHIVSAVVGVVVLKLVGPNAWAAAAAVGLAMAAMHVTRTFHPPAGINPLLVVIHELSWDFVLVPVFAGAALLALFAFLWHRLIRRYPWPIHWW